MKEDHAKEIEISEQVLKLTQTPEERGFICFEHERCELCITAATNCYTTTPCEDELEDDEYADKVTHLDSKSHLGIYSAPHIYEAFSFNSKIIDNGKVKVYRAWIKTIEGGVCGFPFPSSDYDQAKIIAYRLTWSVRGKLINLEELEPLELKP